MSYLVTKINDDILVMVYITTKDNMQQCTYFYMLVDLCVLNIDYVIGICTVNSMMSYYDSVLDSYE